MYQYKANVVRIVDGDTLYLDVDLGFTIRMTINVRLRGIDTPEIRGPERLEGLKAMAFVENAVPPGSLVVIETHKIGKYGRYLADLWYLPNAASREEIQSAGRLLNQELLDHGLAVPYNP